MRAQARARERGADNCGRAGSEQGPGHRWRMNLRQIPPLGTSNRGFCIHGGFHRDGVSRVGRLNILCGDSSLLKLEEMGWGDCEVWGLRERLKCCRVVRTDVRINQLLCPHMRLPDSGRTL
eukprot:6189244-Pleurochrysis_carterae.AAC.3